MFTPFGSYPCYGGNYDIVEFYTCESYTKTCELRERERTQKENLFNELQKL